MPVPQAQALKTSQVTIVGEFCVELMPLPKPKERKRRYCTLCIMHGRKDSQICSGQRRKQFAYIVRNICKKGEYTVIAAYYMVGHMHIHVMGCMVMGFVLYLTAMVHQNGHYQQWITWEETDYYNC